MAGKLQAFAEDVSEGYRRGEGRGGYAVDPMTIIAAIKATVTIIKCISNRDADVVRAARDPGPLGYLRALRAVASTVGGNGDRLGYIRGRAVLRRLQVGAEPLSDAELLAVIAEARQATTNSPNSESTHEPQEPSP